MTDVRVIFPAAPERWLLIADDAIVARGEQASAIAPQPGETRLLVAPATVVAVHEIDLPALAPAQARAAARLALADQSLLPPDQLHLTCAIAREGLYNVALVPRDEMTNWIERFDPDIIVPAALMLPLPDEGYARAAIADEIILRGGGRGFAEDPILTRHVVGSSPVVTLDTEALEAAIINSASAPPLNLRDGEFARRQKVDPRWLRRIAMLAVVLLLISLAIPLVEIARLSRASGLLEETSASLAQAALGENVAPEAAVGALDARLAGLRGGGGGFVRVSAAALRAIEATANVELMSLSFDPGGTLRLSIRAANADEIAAVAARMRATGLDVNLGTINPSQGQPVVELRVRGQ